MFLTIFLSQFFLKEKYDNVYIYLQNTPFILWPYLIGMTFYMTSYAEWLIDAGALFFTVMDTWKGARVS